MNITATAIAVTLAVVVALAFLFLGPSVLRPFGATTTNTTATAPQDTSTTMATSSNPNPSINPQKLPTTLTVTDITVGTGATAKAGDMVTVNYIGALPDGTVFDASAKHGQAFSFTLGGGQVIPGWDKGLVGMKVGGKRQLIIPPDMAYGSRGAGSIIPPNATLLFEVELVKIGQ
jgi:peptidylprolyl isomerase